MTIDYVMMKFFEKFCKLYDDFLHKEQGKGYQFEISDNFRH